MPSITTFLSLICLILGSSQAGAGAWVQQKGGYYLKFSTGYLATTEEFNHEGKRLAILEEQPAFDDASFLDFSLISYLEYGLNERLTLVASLPFKALRAERTVRIGGGLLKQREIVNTTGLADLTLSLRRALLVSPLALSLQGGLKLPLGYEKQPANDGPPLGTGEPDGELHLLLDKSLYPLPAYLGGSVGYRRHGGRLHDEVLYTFEVGYSRGRVLLKLALDGLKNTSPPPDIAGRLVLNPLPGGGGALPELIAGDQDIVKVDPAIIYNLRPGLDLQGELLYVAAGKNALSGTIYSLGVVFSRPD